MKAVNTHITQNNKIRHTHLRFTICSVRHLVNTHTPAALQWPFQALYLLYKAYHSGKRHVAFCCSKQLNRTLLLSSLMRTLLCFILYGQSSTCAVEQNKPLSVVHSFIRSCIQSFIHSLLTSWKCVNCVSRSVSVFPLILPSSLPEARCLGTASDKPRNRLLLPSLATMLEKCNCFFTIN